MIVSKGKVVISDELLASIEGYYDVMNKYRNELRDLVREKTKIKKWVLDYALERKTFKGFVSYIERRVKENEMRVE